MKKLSHITILDQYAVDMDIVLGQGSTGSVYQGLDMKTGKKVAIKIVDLRTINNQVAQYLLNMEKIAIMSVKNPYILQGLKVAQDTKYCFMVTEYCNGGTLKRYIKNSKNGYLNEDKALNILHSLLLGERSIIQKGIIHRDLKPANIMLHEDVPKIIDFGYCEIKGYMKPSLQYNVGSPSYMAPQSFDTNIYNQKTQIWAIGVILFQCLTGKTIDEGRHMSQVYHQLQVSGVPYPSHVSYYSRNIINWCLNKNPQDRPTFQQLIQTYFSHKVRSNSKRKYQLQNNSFYKRYQISKIQPCKSTNKMHQQNIVKKISKLDQALFKSGKIDNKKHYKVPEFLQASQKFKTQNEKYNPRLNTCYSTRNQFIDRKFHKQIDENKQNTLKSSNTFETNFQYGNFNIVTDNDKRRKLNINELYEKICKNEKNIPKNRVFSTQVSVSPSQRLLKKISSNKYQNVPLKQRPKQFPSRNKRTVTQRNNYLRA